MRNKIRILLSVSALLLFCFFMSEMFYGDTIFKKDREKVKGVVVEEYKDRVVLSTMDGEQKILRRDIKRIDYDREEQNLTRMGNLYQDRGMYKEAYHYYSQALKINPEYKSAKEGLDYTGSMLQQFGRRMKLEHISKMNDEKAWRSGVDIPEETMEAQLRRVLGFSVESHGANFRVTSVRKGSPATDAGLLKGDVIVAVWGRMVGYTRPEEFIKRIVSPEVMEVRLTILRNAEIEVKKVSGNLPSLIGADIEYSETEGFEVSTVSPGSEAEMSGLVPGDILVEVEGKATRYMPMREMEKMFIDKKGSSVNVSARRNISLWKQFEEK